MPVAHMPKPARVGQASADEQKRQQDQETARLNQGNTIAALARHPRAEKVRRLEQLDSMTNAERLANLNHSKQFQRFSEATKQDVIAQLAVIVPLPPTAPQLDASYTATPVTLGSGIQVAGNGAGGNATIASSGTTSGDLGFVVQIIPID